MEQRKNVKIYFCLVKEKGAEAPYSTTVSRCYGRYVKETSSVPEIVDGSA